MNNLLLITDVARLRKVFGHLTGDKNIRLRVVNNLEKGGEEIAIEKPDAVFVQTHLSGLSADILLMHLKKQLGRKRSRFVLIASPGQTSAAILKQYQGYLDASAEDSELLSELKKLLATFFDKPKKSENIPTQEPFSSAGFKPQPVSLAESSSLLGVSRVSGAIPPPLLNNDQDFPVVSTTASEPSLEEQGVTYAPRQRLKVYSEFNRSFDNAVSSTPDPESLEQATPNLVRDWNSELVDTVETKPTRSKRRTFLFWLVPVVISVIVLTYLQQRKPAPKPEPALAKIAPAAVVAPATPSPPSSVPEAIPAKLPAGSGVVPPVTPQDQERLSDKAVLTAIAENRGSKSPVIAAPSGARPTSLPDFIPRNGLDKTFSAANPGWERYKGRVTEFKVLREAQAIKAIQIIDRGGDGVPESFVKGVVRQVTQNPALSVESEEKKDGYEIQRGRISENIGVVYYRDENGGKLRAFVLTWH